MKTYALFEPDIYLMSTADCDNTTKRNSFLNHLLDNLSEIEKLKKYNSSYSIKILWTPELSELLYNSPRLQPWRQDEIIDKRLIPVIYKSFFGNLEHISVDDCTSDVSIEPELNVVQEKFEIYPAFLKLCHWSLLQDIQFMLCLGINNKHHEGLGFKIKCECHSKSFFPECVFESHHWFSHPSLIHRCWPSQLLDLYILKHFIVCVAKDKYQVSEGNLKYAFSFSSRFCKKAFQESSKEIKSHLVTSIALRLTKTQKEASSDHSLKDEPVYGDADIRRFRFSGSNRIHYKYLGEREIEFVEYFREGEHDDGLR